LTWKIHSTILKPFTSQNNSTNKGPFDVFGAKFTHSICRRPQIHLHPVLDGRLGHFEQEGGSFHENSGHLFGFLQKRGRRDHFVDQADAFRLSGIYILPAKNQLLGFGDADYPRKPLGTPSSREGPEPGMGIPQTGIVRGNPNVAGTGKLQPSRQAITGDGGDHRFSHVFNQVIIAVRSFGRKLIPQTDWNGGIDQIRTCTKDLHPAGKNHYPSLIVLAGIL
jgi:hypothetical protein